MSREYICGVVRDHLKRFLVIEYHLANSKRVASVSAESWVSKDETPLKALNIEFKNYFGIHTLDNFNIKATKTMTRVNHHGAQNISMLLLDLRKPTVFRFKDDVADAFFLPWEQLMNAVKNEVINPTTYSKCVTDRLYSWKEV